MSPAQRRALEQLSHEIQAALDTAAAVLLAEDAPARPEDTVARALELVAGELQVRANRMRATAGGEG